MRTPRKSKYNFTDKRTMIPGDVYGNLTVIDEVGETMGDYIVVECLCECGEKVHVERRKIREIGAAGCKCMEEEDINDMFAEPEPIHQNSILYELIPEEDWPAAEAAHEKELKQKVIELEAIRERNKGKRKMQYSDFTPDRLN